MRWKFIRLPHPDCRPEETLPGEIVGTVEVAMQHLLALKGDSLDYFLAATVGPPSAFGLPAGWLLVDITRNRRGWSGSHALSSTARAALGYELQRREAKPRLFRVVRRDGTIAQLVLNPAEGSARLGPPPV